MDDEKQRSKKLAEQMVKELLVDPNVAMKDLFPENPPDDSGVAFGRKKTDLVDYERQGLPASEQQLRQTLSTSVTGSTLMASGSVSASTGVTSATAAGYAATAFGVSPMAAHLTPTRFSLPTKIP